jgi:hypothetical protein
MRSRMKGLKACLSADRDFTDLLEHVIPATEFLCTMKLDPGSPRVSILNCEFFIAYERSEPRIERLIGFHGSSLEHEA